LAARQVALGHPDASVAHPDASVVRRDASVVHQDASERVRQAQAALPQVAVHQTPQDAFQRAHQQVWNLELEDGLAAASAAASVRNREARVRPALEHPSGELKDARRREPQAAGHRVLAEPKVRKAEQRPEPQDAPQRARTREQEPQALAAQPREPTQELELKQEPLPQPAARQVQRQLPQEQAAELPLQPEAEQPRAPVALP
jgi:hypothetical protein